MSPARRRRNWLLAILVIDAVDFLLSYNAHRHYVAGPGQPTVMPLGQLLGWSTSVILLIVLLVATYTTFRTRNLPSYQRVSPPQR